MDQPFGPAHTDGCVALHLVELPICRQKHISLADSLSDFGNTTTEVYPQTGFGPLSLVFPLPPWAPGGYHALYLGLSNLPTMLGLGIKHVTIGLSECNVPATALRPEHVLMAETFPDLWKISNKFWHTLWAALCWNIWIDKNNHEFGNERSDVQQISKLLG